MSHARYYVGCAGCGWPLPVDNPRPRLIFCGPCRNDRRQAPGRPPDQYDRVAADLVRRGLAGKSILDHSLR